MQTSYNELIQMAIPKLDSLRCNWIFKDSKSVSPEKHRTQAFFEAAILLQQLCADGGLPGS
jgi:hypothetical protein